MYECAWEKITRDAIRFVTESDPKLVSAARKKHLLTAKILAKQLERREADLHKNLLASIEKVVGDKKILLWKQLLEQNGYDDMNVANLMTEGVRLVGSHDHPSCYPLKLKPASMSESELRDSAVACRMALESRRPQAESRGSLNIWKRRLRRKWIWSSLKDPISFRPWGDRSFGAWPVEDHEAICDSAGIEVEAYRWWLGGSAQLRIHPSHSPGPPGCRLCNGSDIWARQVWQLQVGR